VIATDPASAADKKPNLRTVALGSMVGTTIEWYDFYMYATASALVFKPLFFPHISATAGTLASFATYAAGFGARPIGALVAGHFGDRVGRKAMLVGALVLMGLVTAAIGALPTYAQAGLLAPSLLATLRVVQGLAVGAEWGGAAVLSVEHAPPGQRGLFGSFTQLGSPAGHVAGHVHLLRDPHHHRPERLPGLRVADSLPAQCRFGCVRAVSAPAAHGRGGVRPSQRRR
jgi:MFS family permease